MAGLLSLIENESGGNYQAQNNAMGAGGMAGHFGRLQFGQARLQDAMRAGVIPQGFTPQQFMADPAAQQRVEQWHFSDIDQQAEAMGLNRFIGQTIDGATIDQEAIRAMAHLGGIGGAQRFLESGGQYNPSDVNGTSLRDYATRHGGGNSPAQIGADTMAAIGQPQGLLSTTISAMNAPQQTARPSFWDNVPGLSDPDRRARLAIGLEGLALNPNQGWMQSLQGGIDTRAEDRRMNQTAQWLRSQPGGEQFAAALEAGADAQGVFNAYLQSQQPQSPMDLAQLEQVQLQNEAMRNENMALPGADVGVRASEILPDGTLIQSTDAGPRVFSPTGEELLGQAAADAVLAARAYGVENERSVYGGRREGTLGADITMGGEAAAATAGGATTGQIAAERASTAPAQIQAADMAISSIDAILQDPALGAGTGASSFFSMVPGTPGYGFQARVDQLKGGAFLTAIQQLQGMGALSNAEGATAGAAIARLDTAQSQEDFVAALSDYRAVVQRGKENALRMAGAPATGVRVYNPATGQLE